MTVFTKKIFWLYGIFVLVVALSALTTDSVRAAPIDKFPVTVTQPDGTELHIFASGDEFFNWLQDAQGYTVIQDPVSGYFVYSDLVNGQLSPTGFVVGQIDPSSTGLRPYLNILPEEKEKIRHEFLAQSEVSSAGIQSAPQTGVINNLVIFIRFSGEAEFTNSTSSYTSMLNSATAEANSLRNYFQEVSYNTLTVNSSLFPTPGATIVSYRDSQVRGYYQPYSGTNLIGYTGGDSGLQRQTREHTLLKNAVHYVNSLGQFPSGGTVDADNDGYVDSLTFVVSGGPNGWSSLLWPHMWSLYTYPVTINGKTVGEYSFHLQSSINSGVLAHEMFHVLGSPDLYHYSGDGLQPVGGWDVMEWNMNPPQHMGCYMKSKYGKWIGSVPEIITPGTYILNPLTASTNNCYKIPSPNSATEYFIVEYRREASSIFENSLPGTGLLAYRINSTQTGNAGGPPDEVYIYRPGGTTSIDGSIDSANFSSNVNRTAINDATNPSSFLASGGPGGLNLCNIGAAGTTISFDICSGSDVYISGNTGVVGATISYTDTTPKTVTADGNGFYSFRVPSGWSGTVTPAKFGYTFTPASKSYTNLVANQLAQNYSAVGPVNLLQDPGFELYTPNPYWTESSTNFGTPLCTSGCGSRQHAGSVWAWFGGTSANEVGLLSQTVTIPNGYSALLEFYLWADVSAGGDVSDIFTAGIDSTTVFSVNATQAASYAGYTLVSLNISAFADGASHTIIFAATTNEQSVSFHLDDTALLVIPPSNSAIVTDSWAVQVSPSANINQLATQVGAQNLGQIGSLTGYYLFRIPGSETQTMSTAALFSANPQVLWFEQQAARGQSKRDDTDPKNPYPNQENLTDATTVTTATVTADDVNIQNNASDVSSINTPPITSSPEPAQIPVTITESFPATTPPSTPVPLSTQTNISPLPSPTLTQIIITQIPPSSIPTRRVQPTKIAALPKEPSLIPTTMIRSIPPSRDSGNHSSNGGTGAAALSIAIVAIGSVLFSIRRKK